MLKQTAKIFEKYEQEDIKEDMAEQIESNIKAFFEIIVEWNEKEGMICNCKNFSKIE